MPALMTAPVNIVKTKELLPIGASVYFVPYQNQYRLTFLAWPGRAAFSVLEKAFSQVAMSNPPAKLRNFSIGFHSSGDILADVTFLFEHEGKGKAVERTLKDCFKFETHSGKPDRDSGWRCEVSFEGDGCVSDFAKAFNEFNRAGFAVFSGMGSRRSNGIFRSNFSLQIPDFTTSPLPSVIENLKTFGFSNIEKSDFSQCCPRKFEYAPNG